MKNVFYHILFGMVVILIGCSNSENSYSANTLENVTGDLEYLESDSSSSIPKEESNSYLNVQARLLPEAGFYEPFTLTPPKAQFGGSVKCTFDGSEPQADTDVFAEDVFIDKTTTVRCTEYRNSLAVGSSTETYFINEDINMPVVSISTDPDYVETHIKAPPCSPNPCKSAAFWDGMENPVHVEYFDKGSLSAKKDFEVDAGVSIAGGWSRNNLKKSISITLRKEYQKGRIVFPLFSVRPEYNTFKSLKLRNNGNRFKSDFICDPMATSLLEGTKVDYQRSRQVVCFFNGEFFGIFDMREKLNEHFVELNHGISDKKVDVIKHINTDVTAVNGNADGYLDLLEYVNQIGLIDSTEFFEHVWTMLDQESYVDYMAAEMYFHNGDWPQNNVKAWKGPNTPWRFMVYDVDHGFDWNSPVSGFDRNTNILQWVFQGGRLALPCGKGESPCFSNLFVQLFKSDDFKRQFINRSVVLYAEKINSKKVAKSVDDIVSTLDPNVIARDLEKFPRKAYKNQCGGGFDSYGTCIKKWAVQRDSIVREEFRSALKLGKDVDLTFVANGNGKIKMEYFDLPEATYSATFYAKSPILLTAVPNDGSTVFESWEDGSVENPRLVVPTKKSVFEANFR